MSVETLPLQHKLAFKEKKKLKKKKGAALLSNTDMKTDPGFTSLIYLVLQY